jgi:mannitol-specific phosphotransferase system IIBC component
MDPLTWLGVFIITNCLFKGQKLQQDEIDKAEELETRRNRQQQQNRSNNSSNNNNNNNNNN